MFSKLSNQFIIVAVLVLVAVAMRFRPATADTSKEFNIKKHMDAYQAERMQIKQTQDDYFQHWQVASTEHQKTLLKEVKSYLEKTIPDRIFTYWYGTKWDFNGTTQHPRKGKIACGYFVTTTLEHAGIDLPRVKLAQQASSVLINAICQPKSIQTYRNIGQLERYLRARPDGLYILGLDKHVGFVQKDGEALHFIHSTLRGSRQVLRENMMESKTVNKSKVLVIGDLLSNEKLLRAWINKESIGYDFKL